MNRKKRFLTVLLAASSILILTGCKKDSNFIERIFQEKLIEQSENVVYNTPEYQQYIHYVESSMVSEEGEAILPDSKDTTITGEKSFLITIANNPFLNCTYHTEGKTKTNVSTSEIELHAGDSLYVDKVEINNPVSDKYDFSCFRIWSYNQKGDREQKPYAEIDARSGMLLTIPKDYSGTGFSIEPLGCYTNRQIRVKAFYLKGEKEQELSGGSWQVNNIPFTDSYEITPYDPYTIVYDYSVYDNANNKEYYFVSSTPECFYSKESNHTVLFKETRANEGVDTFTVQMHPYISLIISNSCIGWTSNIPMIGNKGEGIIKSITVDGEKVSQESFSQKEFTLPIKLKVGNVITIVVGKEYRITGKSQNLNVGTATPAQNGFEYKIIIPDGDKEIGIDITDRNSDTEGTFQGYNHPHATVDITYENGKKINIGDELPGDSEKVILSIIPEEGYYIKGFNTDDYGYTEKRKEFSKLNNSISSTLDEHPALQYLKLKLATEDSCGTYSYTLDGVPIEVNELSNVRAGQKLKVTFTANPGYKISHSWFGADAAFGVLKHLGGKDSITESIEISTSMSVDKELFGIVVEKER